MVRKPCPSPVPLGDKCIQGFCCSVFRCSHAPEPHAPHYRKYTASNVRPDLLCSLKREPSKSVFEPNNDNKQH